VEPLGSSDKGPGALGLDIHLRCACINACPASPMLMCYVVAEYMTGSCLPSRMYIPRSGRLASDNPPGLHAGPNVLLCLYISKAPFRYRAVRRLDGPPRFRKGNKIFFSIDWTGSRGKQWRFQQRELIAVERESCRAGAGKKAMSECYPSSFPLPPLHPPLTTAPSV
jgi:hypothetical protein